MSLKFRVAVCLFSLIEGLVITTRSGKMSPVAVLGFTLGGGGSGVAIIAAGGHESILPQ